MSRGRNNNNNEPGNVTPPPSFSFENPSTPPPIPHGNPSTPPSINIADTISPAEQIDYIYSKLSSHSHLIKSQAAENITKFATEIISNVAAQSNRQRKFDNIFDGNLCLGEGHDDISSKRFLIENMQRFKKEGFEILFMEHLCLAEHQELLDSYFNSSANEMPNNELRKYLTEINEGHMDEFIGGDIENYSILVKKYNFLTVIEAAKQADIRIIALEHNINTYRYSGLSQGINRTVSFNYQATKVIRENQANNSQSKWIAFIGDGHLNFHQERNIAGIADILQCQDLLIRDNRENENTEIVSSSSKEKGKKQGVIASIWINANPNQTLEYDNLVEIYKNKKVVDISSSSNANSTSYLFSSIESKTNPEALPLSDITINKKSPTKLTSPKKRLRIDQNSQEVPQDLDFITPSSQSKKPKLAANKEDSKDNTHNSR